MSPLLIYPLLAGLALPYVFTIVAKAGAFGPSQNHRTRDWQGELEGWRKRAHWAQQNTFEVLPMFIAAVIVAGVRDVETTTVVTLAWAFVGLRVLYGVCYIRNWPRPRSMVFFAGLGTLIAMFVLAIRA